MNIGWKCTECGKCYAPHVSECASCNAAPKTDEDTIVYEFNGHKLWFKPSPYYKQIHPYWSITPYDPNVTFPTYTLRDIGLPSPEYRVTCGSTQ